MAVGVKVTAHVPCASEQLCGEKPPLAFVENATAPVGVLWVPAPVLVTVAVHVVGASRATAWGWQATDVAVPEPGATPTPPVTPTAIVSSLAWSVESPR